MEEQGIFRVDAEIVGYETDATIENKKLIYKGDKDKSEFIGNYKEMKKRYQSEEYWEIVTKAQNVTKGESAGHPFRGNQWVEVISAGAGGKNEAEKVVATSGVDAFYTSLDIIKKELSREEKDAITIYIGDGHKGINRHYRHGDTSDTELAVTFDRAFNKASVIIGRDENVYRGWKLTTNSDSLDWISKLKIGDSIEDKGFISTSTEKQTARDFAGYSDTVDSVLITIKIPKGTEVLAGSVSESELIINRGRKMKVIGIKKIVRGESEHYEIEMELI